MNMNAELLDFKKFLIIDIRDSIRFYIMDNNILTNEEFANVNKFDYKDDIELVSNQYINHYYENAFGYDNTSFDDKLKKVFYYYRAKLDHFRATNFISDNVLIDIIENLFNEPQTVLK